MSTVDRPKPSMLGVWCLGCLLAAVGVFLFAVARSGTREFWIDGAFDFFIIGVLPMLVTVFGASAAFLVIGWFTARSRLAIGTQRVLLLIPWILAAVFWIILAEMSASARSRFTSVVVRPVPASVRDIRAAGFNSFLATRWLVKFTIDPRDLPRIVIGCQLSEAEPFDLPGVVQQDLFLRRLDWALDMPVPETDGCRFFSRREGHADAMSTVLLVYDPAVSRAWFLRSYQN